MLAIELYQTLNNEGVQLWTEGEKLRFAPKEKITPFLLAELKANKSELLLLLDTNNPHTKGDIKPVLKVVAKSEPLNDGADLIHQLETQVKNESYPQSEDGQLNRKSEEAAPKLYGDDIFPKNGDNRVGRNNSFNQRKESLVHQQGEHEPVQAQPHTATHSQPYATDELLTRYEKPLFNHLLACPYCHIEKAQYCASGYAMGSVYDALLLNRDDAQARRESLALRVDRACISGRSVYVSFSSIDAPPPPMQTAPITRKYGNTHEYETFINHWTACEVCKPNLGRYCSEGQRLKVVA